MEWFSIECRKLNQNQINMLFYRYGGHFEFINLKHIIRFPGGKHAKCFRDAICHFSLQRCVGFKFVFLFKYYGRSTGRERERGAQCEER